MTDIKIALETASKRMFSSSPEEIMREMINIMESEIELEYMSIHDASVADHIKSMHQIVTTEFDIRELKKMLYKKDLNKEDFLIMMEISKYHIGGTSLYFYAKDKIESGCYKKE